MVVSIRQFFVLLEFTWAKYQRYINNGGFPVAGYTVGDWEETKLETHENIPKLSGTVLMSQIHQRVGNTGWFPHTSINITSMPKKLFCNEINVLQCIKVSFEQ